MEKECGQEFWRRCSLSKRPSFLETFIESHRVQRLSTYMVLTFEPLLGLYLGNSKSVKGCMVRYLSSEGVATGKAQEAESSMLKYGRIYSESIVCYSWVPKLIDSWHELI